MSSIAYPTQRRALARVCAAATAAGILLTALAGPVAIPTLQQAASPAADSAAPAGSPGAALAALQARADGPLLVHWRAAAGIPDFVGGEDGALRLPYRPSLAEIGNPIAIARGFLDEQRALFGLAGVDDDLAMLRVEPDAQMGFTHVRFSQTYRGLPVFGREMIVHLDSQNRIAAVNGQFSPGLGVSTEPTLSAADAEAVALRYLREFNLDPAEAARVRPTMLPGRTELAVFVDDSEHATLAWRVKILTASPLGQWSYFVNARRPAVAHAIDASETARRRRTFTARNSTDVPGRLLIDEGERSADPIAQAAQDGAGKVYDYYFNTFKRDSLDGHGMTLVSTVHYGDSQEDSENAAWVGEASQMIYGDGGRLFRPLAYGLDVVGHELTHGVIEYTANLVYEGQAGALNESYADVFGVLISGSNWEVGRGTVKSPPFPVPYLRSMTDPNAAGNYDAGNPLGGVGQPASMREYANLPLSRKADNGGVHINSGIPNHAAAILGQAIGRDKMQQIYYRALTQYLTPRATFLDAANATVRAAQDLYGATEANAARQAFAQVGVGANAPDAPAPPPPAKTQPPAGRSAPAPVPAPALPTSCVDVVTNGGFESDAGWKQATKGNTGMLDTEQPHTGNRSAWLGGQDQEAVQSIFQDVTIPSNARTVKLAYWRLLHEETSGVLGLFASPARFTVAIANPGSDTRAVLEQFESDSSDDTWQQAEFDVSQLAGKTVRLLYASENPRRNISSFFIDDVSLVACTTGTGPAAPSTPSRDLVYVGGQITDADTNRAVSGAQVFVLKPGLAATDAAADDQVTTAEVETSAISDRSGNFQTDAAVQRDARYSVIVIAKGYRPIVADDGIQIPASAANPYVVNATLRKSR